jgi:diguanylate cyclase (GGDEF)-like protein
MLIVLAALLALGLVGFLDYLTSYQVSFAVFYLVPVGGAAWYGGKYQGIVLSFLASIVWYVVEVLAGPLYDHPAIPVWNACVRLVFFLVTSLLLSALRDRLAIETKLARTDGRTGLLNSRAFTERLAHDLALNSRSGETLTVVYIDLDDFKSINDRRGHAEGDRELQRVARRIVEVIRHSDSASRLGGDEFALILPATGRAGAESFLKKLNEELNGKNGKQGVNCSIGALTIAGVEPAADEVIGRADGLMYAAKQAGKNQFVVQSYAQH